MKKKICMILVAVFVAVLGTSTYFIIDHHKESNKQAALYGELADLVNAAAQTDAATEPAEQIPYSEEKMLLPELAELYQQNGDLVGWISIADTNINYPVMQSVNEPNFLKPTDKKAALLEFIAQHRDESGIVYCSTRKNVEKVTELLKDNGISAARYHAGLEEEERREGQTAFLYDKVKVMVATNAFGMGIDKQNVSYVVHYNMPKNMEAYYQEAGRAGRDGSKAECLLLYGAGDVRTAEFFINNSTEGNEGGPQAIAQRRKIEFDKLDQMKNYCFTSGCLRHYILDYFGEDSPLSCDNCGNCRAKKRIAATLAKPTARPQKTERSLYEMLRSVRLDFAEKAGLPPELIFTDRSLQAMAVTKPQNEHDMMEIPGVSPVKYQMYGKTFLRVIQRNSDRRSGVE